MAVGDDKANGDTLTPEDWNTMEDDQLTRLKNNGSVKWTGDQDADSHTVKNLSAPSDDNDAARKADLDAQTHTASEITDFDTEVSNNDDVSSNTSHRGTTSGNPHSVTKSDVSLGNVLNEEQVVAESGSINIWVQDSQPTAENTGDLWFDTSE